MNTYWIRKRMFRNGPIIRLMQKVDEMLAEYDFHCPDETLYDLVLEWIEHQKHQGKNKSTILKELKSNPIDAATVIVGEILGEMAEERPGTDPFNHYARIPISLSSLIWVTQGLAMTSAVATFNNSSALAQEATAGIIALLNRVFEQPSQEELTLVLGEDRMKELDFSDPITLVPQSGLAYVARRIEGALDNLDEGRWNYLTSEHEAQDDLYENLFAQVELIRDLNKVYGQSVEPTQGS